MPALGTCHTASGGYEDRADREDAFYHACDQSDTALLERLFEPGFESMINHKLDLEDVARVRWFLERGAYVNANHSLHHAICRGRGLAIIGMLLDAGADVNRPWDRWDRGRRPLALAARCGHVAAYELLEARGATAELDPVDAAVLGWPAASPSSCPGPLPRRSGFRRGATTGGSSGSSRS